jgi:hypothetical protein
MFIRYSPDLRVLLIQVLAVATDHGSHKFSVSRRQIDSLDLVRVEGGAHDLEPDGARRARTLGFMGPGLVGESAV